MIEFFVNYRSADEPYAASLIAQALSTRFGPERVFLDTSSIPAGEHFPRQISTALSGCRTLLAVIGRRWLEPDDAGRRRIDDPADYVRREIAVALQRDVAVVPVLVGGASLPAADELPDDIAALAERQAVQLRARGAAADVERLVDDLERPSGPPDREARSAVTNTFHGPVEADTIGISHASYTAGERSRDR